MHMLWAHGRIMIQSIYMHVSGCTNRSPDFERDVRPCLEPIPDNRLMVVIFWDTVAVSLYFELPERFLGGTDYPHSGYGRI